MGMFNSNIVIIQIFGIIHIYINLNRHMSNPEQGSFTSEDFYNKYVRTIK
jgi:hypothetical protein